MKVLITGGTGYFGSWLLKKQPEFVEGRYLSHPAYDSHEWETDRYDYIIHCANISPACVLEKARQDNSRVLYISSGAVYTDADTDYRRNKVKWEAECLESGVNVVIARPFAFANSSPSWAEFFKAARAGKPLQIWGDGWVIRSFMHGRDLGEWLWAILFYGERGENYDVGSDQPITIRRFARRIRALTGCKIEYIEKEVPVPVYLPKDTSKAKALLKLYKERMLP